MFFNDDDRKTNIDSEFDKENGFKFLFDKKLVLIVGGLVLGVILMVVISKFLFKKSTYYLDLNGSEELIIYQNSIYNEPGYEAYDSKGNKYNDQVIVDGYVNSDIVGEYIITYTFNEFVKTRNVSVISETKHITYLILKGESLIYLKVGEEYKEDGWRVIDSVDNNLEDKVVVSGKVDTSKAGTYKLTYSVKNGIGVTVSSERTVIVMGSDIDISYDDGYKKDSVSINIAVINNYFDYILLPDGKKDNKRVTSYKVSNNGDYSFKFYEKDGTFIEKKVTINNIDKEAPSGSCKGVYKSNTYTIDSTVKDNLSGIKNIEYYVNGKVVKTTKDNKITVNQNKTDNIEINVIDNVGNSKKITCSVDNSAYVAPSLSSSSSSSSKGSSSGASNSSAGGYNYLSGCSRMSATYNGSSLSYDHAITMSVGQTITIKLTFPTGCGSVQKLTRTSASGQSDWTDYFSGTSRPSVSRYNESSWISGASGYNWIITAKKKTPGYVILSQTSEQIVGPTSKIKNFFRIKVKVQ